MSSTGARVKIVFDSTIKLAGIGLVPWTRLGPERWFPDYKIASLYGWDLGDVSGAPSVVALSDHVIPLPPLAAFNSQHLVETPAFQQLLGEQLPAYHLLTYRPVTPPKALQQQGYRFLSMDKTLTATLENKVAFRQAFADLDLPFPPYKIMQRSDLRPDQTTLKRLLGGRTAVVLQDEALSGGKGTFVIKDLASLRYALTSLSNMKGGKRVVISDYIDGGRERSVQCVVTRYGTFVGPLQKQIIGHPLLANLQVPDGDRFCGGEISPDDPLIGTYPEITSYAQAIGKRLHSQGYRGIFSLDCLVDGQNKVYVLEINPRLTGMTPLVTMLHRDGQDIPFYLLHILETAGMDYEITDDYINPLPPTGSLLVLHSPKTAPGYIIKAPASGLYGARDGVFAAKRHRLQAADPADHMLLQQYTPPGFKIKPGGRMLTAVVNGRVLDNADKLRPEVQRTIESLIGQVQLKQGQV